MTVLDILDENYLLLSGNVAYSAKPITTLSKFLKDKKKINLDDKIITIFNGKVFEMSAFTTTEKLIDEIRKYVAFEYEEQYSKKVKSFLGISQMILEKKNAEMLYTNRVYALFKNNHLYLCKEILPYTIKYRKNKFDFTGCVIYVKMKDVKYFSKPAIMMKQGYSRYKHPHVYKDNNVCLGTYKPKYSLQGAVHALNQTEQILVSGHFTGSGGEIPGQELTLSKFPNKRGGFI